MLIVLSFLSLVYNREKKSEILNQKKNKNKNITIIFELYLMSTTQQQQKN